MKLQHCHLQQTHMSKHHIPFETTHKQEEMLKEDDSVSVKN
jgi:hypothetical protein